MEGALTVRRPRPIVPTNFEMVIVDRDILATDDGLEESAWNRTVMFTSPLS